MIYKKNFTKKTLNIFYKLKSILSIGENNK
ncbi:hypothetical protein M8044_000469 [Columbia Basin potato purple top phytoplasma]|uniref:Uncharacterized protein n=1 Tax=Columbia Basin potato purple top phytoplasma TaxID=307134 RepID=A0ABT5L9H7_9MOLU|nr:hypothetical protein [Columbia Basin potato purple top phytoplasma]